MKNISQENVNSVHKRQCLGNYCTLEKPHCETCGIDDTLDDLERRLNLKPIFDA